MRVSNDSMKWSLGAKFEESSVSIYGSLIVKWMKANYGLWKIDEKAEIVQL